MRGLGLFLGLSRRTAAGGPVNTVAPAVTGVGYAGFTLSCSTGNWTGTPSAYTYQWKRNGVNIALATAATYTMTTADEGTNITCAVTASNTFGASAPASSNTIRLWIPTDLGATLRAWWDAEDASTITIATGISQWTDKSGGGNTLAQATGANQPGYSANSAINNKAAATFSGTQWINKGANSLFANLSGVRAVMLWRPTVVAADIRAIWASVNGGTTTRFLYGSNGSSVHAISGRGAADGGTFTQYGPGSVATVANANEATIGILDYSGLSAAIRANGTQGSSVVTTITSPTTQSSNLALGGTSTGANPLTGAIREAMILDGVGTTLENQKIEAYLLWRAGIQALLPGGHPYESVPPT